MELQDIKQEEILFTRHGHAEARRARYDMVTRYTVSEHRASEIQR